MTHLVASDLDGMSNASPFAASAGVPPPRCPSV
eukprot:CAMPEP_0201983316 /NCGR_PEP_ID=MMETSP0904-20121228/79835_1 /ASSEMBLY_ACC=CAM_ASM_000553 /TAXON_ID=420261 /ORGANISM="Thalassiosira antarctica, Strain CCMP982" /LENGTH=32 /DNA_ID= /DNA_START= /DNA_END= /DNA_ORIENTATION=